MEKYIVQCGCGSVEIQMEGTAKISGFCHCCDCRKLLNIPYHSVNAWEKKKVEVTKGDNCLITYQHPMLKMKKYFCKKCGDVVFNSNAMDWRVFSQLVITKNYGGKLPTALKPKGHFFYASRIVNIDDDLPKKN